MCWLYADPSDQNACPCYRTSQKNISEVYSQWSAFMLINTQRKVNKFVVEPKEIVNALGRNTKNWNAQIPALKGISSAAE